MRDAFVSELLLVARRDPQIMLVVGDLGFGVVDGFANELPAQFLNAGVAEQSMVGVAAGLASCGYRVFVYSIANFPTLRALEQIRNDVCYHRLDVTIVSVGAGVSYGTLGYTHHAVEDISIMRALPALRILCPADPMEARAAVHEVLGAPGPAYIRLGKNGEPTLHDRIPESLATIRYLRRGDDALLIGVGAVVGECLIAADILEARGTVVAVASCPTVSPMDPRWLDEWASRAPIFTVEEHRLPGGFGSAVLEEVSIRFIGGRTLRLGLDDTKLSVIGSGSHLRQAHGLDGASIAASVQRALGQ